MKTVFYPKLAWTAIQKNKRMYLPYILTCVGMVMMYYILTFLSVSPLLKQMGGGTTLSAILPLGSKIIAVFALIFLFYTNSFLMRRRKKEFGLYNILGMGKRNIGRILLNESLIIATISLTMGLVAGVALSKLSELGLINIIGAKVNFSFSISTQVIWKTVILFGIIFVLILLNALWQVGKANAVALLHSENTGEKPPKANWILGILGILLLAIAYYTAVTIKDPLSALKWFFIAVILVILATYLLFVSSSVLLCRIMQKKKNYYYKPNHFVSVSSMVYRMKRNGAGLASICILATMVLVMITGSSCLYFGKEDSLRTRFPRDISAEINFKMIKDTGEENIGKLRSEVEKIQKQSGAIAENILDYRHANFMGVLQDGELETDVNAIQSIMDMDSYDKITQIYIVPLADYNRLMGTNKTLAENDAMIYSVKEKYKNNTLTIKDGTAFYNLTQLDTFISNGNAAIDILPSLFIIVPDFDGTVEKLMHLTDNNGDPLVRLNWHYSYDTDLESTIEMKIGNQINSMCKEKSLTEGSGIQSYSVQSLAANRDDFYGTYGGLFFLGIMLSIVFIFATVLIIYYKQISEGYEDQSRFEIMQKVGMTKPEIRRSINSQMLTVFFLPLAAAVLHLAFAFPMINKLLILFNLLNSTLLLITAGISILIFAVFYIFVYRMTSNAYYSIVSGAKES